MALLEDSWSMQRLSTPTRSNALSLAAPADVPAINRCHRHLFAVQPVVAYWYFADGRLLSTMGLHLGLPLVRFQSRRCFTRPRPLWLSRVSAEPRLSQHRGHGPSRSWQRRGRAARGCGGTSEAGQVAVSLGPLVCPHPARPFSAPPRQAEPAARCCDRVLGPRRNLRRTLHRRAARAGGGGETQVIGATAECKGGGRCRGGVRR